MNDSRNPMFNSHGAKDPTAYEAIRNVSAEEQRVGLLIRTLKYIIDVAGFDLLNRIELRDRYTGRDHR